jgi:hypothetical protein
VAEVTSDNGLLSLEVASDNRLLGLLLVLLLCGNRPIFSPLKHRTMTVSCESQTFRVRGAALSLSISPRLISRAPSGFTSVACFNGLDWFVALVSGEVVCYL